MTDEDIMYVPKSQVQGDIDARLKIDDDNFKRLEECDKKAKERGSLVGRFIQEQYADSYAYYQIIKENKKTVRIRVCTGIGDSWTIPYWGKEATIEKSYAIESIRRRDALNRIFSKGK